MHGGSSSRRCRPAAAAAAAIHIHHLSLLLFCCMFSAIAAADRETCSSTITISPTLPFTLLCNKSEPIPGVMTTIFLCNGEALFGCLVSADRSGYLVVVTWMGNTPIWAANRNLPIKEETGVELDRSRGELHLRSAAAASGGGGGGGGVIWAVREAGSAAGLSLRSDGNLVLIDNLGSVIWESFSEPTDLLVPNQALLPPSLLLAGFSSHISATASFSAVMHSAGLILYENSTSRPLPYLAFAYPWIPTTAIAILNASSSSSFACNHTILNLTQTSLSLSLLQSSCLPPSPSPSPTTTTSSSLDFGSPVSFVRLDPDGVLRAYYPDHRPSFNLFLNLSHGLCRVPNACGPYGICSSSSGCRCPDNASVASSDFVPSNTSKFLLSTVKCAPNVPVHCDPQPPPPPAATARIRFLHLTAVDYFANDHIAPDLHDGSFDDCQEACARSCSCKAAFYRSATRECFLHEEVMSMMSVGEAEGYEAALKLRQEGGGGGGGGGRLEEERRSETKLIVGITIATVLSVALFAAWFYRKEKIGVRKDEDELLESLPGQPRRFTYKELQAATWEFSQKLGVGGFGSVYRGVFPDGSSVAVKQLENITASSQGLREFRNEVITLSNINHQNLVHLRGFCAERSHRLLVYEYVPNGSLDSWLFLKGASRPGPHLDWQKRLAIATHTARGLYFLHDQCRNSIIHLDIKPQNILLDQNFVPKISDFGLSRLVNEDHNTAFTRMRGTPGYMAPECLIMTNASSKSDVYSFGMVLLEIVSGRKNVDVSRLVLHGDNESWYFPSFALHKFKENKIDDILDMNLASSLTDSEMAEARRVIQIAFWCIQDQPPLRPAMYKVLHMLEGHSEVRTPPLHSFSFGMRFHLNNTIASSSSPPTPLHNLSSRTLPDPQQVDEDETDQDPLKCSTRSHVSPFSSRHASPAHVSPCLSPINGAEAGAGVPSLPQQQQQQQQQDSSSSPVSNSFLKHSRSPVSSTSPRILPTPAHNTATTASSRFSPLNMVD